MTRLFVLSVNAVMLVLNVWFAVQPWASLWWVHLILAGASAFAIYSYLREPAL